MRRDLNRSEDLFFFVLKSLSVKDARMFHGVFVCCTKTLECAVTDRQLDAVHKPRAGNLINEFKPAVLTGAKRSVKHSDLRRRAGKI